MPPLQCFLGVSKTVRQTTIYLPSRISLGIDFFGICAKVWVKSRDGDTRAGKILREGAVWWKASGCLPDSYRS